MTEMVFDKMLFNKGIFLKSSCTKVQKRPEKWWVSTLTKVYVS